MVLISLAQGYHDSDVTLLTSVSVISATISSSLKTRISKSSDPTRSWKGKESCIVSATSEHSRISVNKTKKLHNTFYTATATWEFQSPENLVLRKVFPLGKSPGSVSEEKVAITDFIYTSGCTLCQNMSFHQEGENTPWLGALLCLQTEAPSQMPETSSHGQETGKSMPDTALGGPLKKLTPRGTIRVISKAKSPFLSNF